LYLRGYFDKSPWTKKESLLAASLARLSTIS